jgi:hypothetical protein
MNAMNAGHQRSDDDQTGINSADQASADWASRFLDDEASPDALPTDLSEESRRQYADHLLLHSLLDAVTRGSGDVDADLWSALSSRLDEAAAESAVEGESVDPIPVGSSAGPTAVSAGGRRNWLISSIGIALSLMVVGSAWLLMPGATPTARAAVEEALQQADRRVDRHYQIKIDLAAVADVEADLYVRGSNQFALHARGPLDVSVWLGIDGEKAWLAPAVGPVVVASEIQAIQERLASLSGLPIEFLMVGNVLRMLERDYTLTMVPQDEQAGTLRHIVAIKRKGFRPLLPSRVDVWTSPKDGLVHQLLLDWSGQVENLAVRRVEFVLTDETPRGASWYEHSDHHADGVPVIQLDAGHLPAAEPASP